MAFGPLYTALPLAAATPTRPATRYVDENSWNTLIGNFSLWQDNVNANAKNLSNVATLTAASFSSTQSMIVTSASFPQYTIYESGVSLNMKRWKTYASGGVLRHA